MKQNVKLVGNICVQGVRYDQLAVRTHFIEKDESFEKAIETYLQGIWMKGDILAVSEKALAMTQGRVVHISQMNIGILARVFEHFAGEINGCGFKSAAKMQLVIDMCGFWKSLFAGICGGIGKLVGIKGLFYKILGEDIAGIDGFYKGSDFPYYRENAILLPVDSVKVCEWIYDTYQIESMIVDINDFGGTILGYNKTLRRMAEEELLQMLKGNPAGQSNEQTPFILIRRQKGAVPV